MIISRLILRNWRNFRFIDIDLTDRVFIVGPNASGKSNLLDALRFLKRYREARRAAYNKLLFNAAVSLKFDAWLLVKNLRLRSM